MKKKTILITGVSSGLGNAFAKKAIEEGHKVIGTVRNQKSAQDFSNLNTQLAYPVLLDINNFDEIPKVVENILNTHGSIDVLINNAGYGHEGILEESPLQELIDQFNTNVFGVVAMIKAVLPSMRKNRNGHIINVTSMGGFITMPGISYYCGSKFALEGISESLGKEVKDFNIHVTTLAPGQFRTDWAGRSMKRSNRVINDYDEIMNPIREAREKKSGFQPGDPDKAAQAVMKIIQTQNPPTRLYLGDDALLFVNDKLNSMKNEISKWEELSRSTNFVEKGN
ncbi:oxidoreductase [Sulfurospirillum diekertiae]|uniref:oxidoreductase n=1 Tax=Sulfurospirillum diekertiae TaxID=1854492 RepID=UPI000B3B42A3